MHASCLPALLIHPYMFTLLSHIINTAIVNGVECVCVCLYVQKTERARERLCACVCVCVCVRVCVCIACYLSGGSGERKQLQGKFWGKRLLNPNIQVGMYIYAHSTSTLSIYK